MDQNIYPVTRKEVGTYPLREACVADEKKQIQDFIASLPKEPDLLAATCVRVTGAEGAAS